MADMEFENEGFEDEDEIRPDDNENIMSNDNVLDQNKVDETNAATGFTFTQSAQAQAHAERGKLSKEISEIAKLQESVEKDAFISKLETYFKQKLNGDRNFLKERIYKKQGAWFFITESKNDMQLTYMKEIKSSGKKAGDIKNLEILRSYNKKAVEELEKIFESTGTPVIPKDGLRLRQAAQRNLGLELKQAAGENIPLETIPETGDVETGFEETSFSEPELRKRSINYFSVEPTMADRQRIFDALRDVDIVEFVQEPVNKSEIDIQLKNANKLQFKLKQAEADFKSAKEHEDDQWIKAAKKEIKSIELHLKTIADKLARLYADKFSDSSLTWPTRLKYLIKLRGFKIGVIVSAIGVSFAALVAGLIESFTPAANVVIKKAIVPVAAIVVKKAGDVIVPVVNSAYQQVKKIIGYVGAGVVWIGKNIIEYMFEHIIILMGVIVLTILTSRSKKLTK